MARIAVVLCFTHVALKKKKEEEEEEKKKKKKKKKEEEEEEERECVCVWKRKQRGAER